jgi:glycosyltransferase involved in cell wall biosynthesis
MTQVSVVVPCLNAAATLAETLESLAAQRCEASWEVIVADNGSSDDSRAIVARHRERMPVRLVDASDRSGQAHAMNVGVAASDGEYVLFCDADDLAGDGWLAAMVAGLRRWDAVGARWDITRLNPPTIRRSRGNPQEHDLQPFTRPPFLPFAGGGSLGVRRRVHAALGGFEEALVVVHDTDFCWRLQLAGYTLRFVPEAVVPIRFRRSEREMFGQARLYGRTAVDLYARYRGRGIPEAGIVDGLRAWAMLVWRGPRLLRPDARQRWLWKLGYRLGRLEGSRRNRVLAP